MFQKKHRATYTVEALKLSLRFLDPMNQSTASKKVPKTGSYYKSKVMADVWTLSPSIGLHGEMEWVLTGGLFSSSRCGFDAETAILISYFHVFFVQVFQ